MSKTNRTIYRVKPSKDFPGDWDLTQGDWAISTFEKKQVAVDLGRANARARWETCGELTQLVVHGRDGKIQFENTYGNDPRKTKG